MTKKKRSDNTQRFALEKRGCFGKIQHKSRLAAEFILSRMRGRDSATLEVYKCKYCTYFHIGHNRKKETPVIKTEQTADGN